MATVSAIRDHMGNMRWMPDHDETVGLSGHGASPLFVFEYQKMYDCFPEKIRTISDYNQQFEYLKRVMFEVIREVDEITEETEVMIISDKKDITQYLENVQQYRDLSDQQTNIKGKIKKLKFFIEKDENMSMDDINNELSGLEDDLAELKPKIDRLRRIANEGFCKDYFGCSFKVRGKSVRVIVTKKRHRFYSKTKTSHKFFVNIWAAVREAV